MKLRNLLLGCIVAASAFSIYSENSHGNNQITLVPRPKKPNDRPNTETPIECSKDKNAIDITFSEDLGMVDVDVTNLNNNQSVKTKLNSSTGEACMGIPTQEGMYRLIIKTKDCDYEGYYNQ